MRATMPRRWSVALASLLRVELVSTIFLGAIVVLDVATTALEPGGGGVAAAVIAVLASAAGPVGAERAARRGTVADRGRGARLAALAVAAYQPAAAYLWWAILPTGWWLLTLAATAAALAGLVS